MNNAPITFKDSMMGDYFNLQPSMVKGRFNIGAARHRRYLWNKLFSVYKFTIPDKWPMNVFRFFLFYYGSLAVVYTKKLGWIMGMYGVSQLGTYYTPQKITVWNHNLPDIATGIIGINAGIIHMMDDYYSLDDLVSDYAEQLADIDKAIHINAMNCNVAVALPAKDKKHAAELRMAYEEATSGQPFIPLNKDLLSTDTFAPLFRDLKANYMINDLLVARRTIVNNFLSDIGIDNANYEKRAQMSPDEITRNSQETKALCEIILENIKDGMDRINRISDLNLGVEFRFKGGENNAQGNANRVLPLEP